LGSKAITKDEETGAVLYSPKIKVKAADLQTIRESCPYDIPRWEVKTGILAKCTMCIDRIKEGLLPACVKTCPTGAMTFGDRKAIVDIAEKRLAEVQSRYPEAMLANAGDVRAIYLLVDNPEKYHKFAVAQSTIGITRKVALRRLFQPLANLRPWVG
jgi:formate dehydrogenase iron-sulfur subunit